jgi:hypothetical protein
MKSAIDYALFAVIAIPVLWALVRLYISIVQYELKQMKSRQADAAYKERIRQSEIAFKAREERMYTAGAAYYNAATDQYYNKNHMVMEEVK